jgi:hypothetical protein
MGRWEGRRDNLELLERLLRILACTLGMRGLAGLSEDCLPPGGLSPGASMSWKIWKTPVLSLILCLVAAAARAQTPVQPEIHLDASGVSIDGLTPGGGAVWFSIWKEVVDYSPRYARRGGMDGSDRQGRLQPELGDETTPPQAIWGVVDLTTGAWALATPEGFPLNRVAPRSTASRGSDATADEFIDSRAYLEGFLVRPGSGGGAWGFSGGDGGAIDADRVTDGRLVVPLDRVRPIGASPAPPAKLGDGDLWFVIDPSEMTVSVQLGGVAQ